MSLRSFLTRTFGKPVEPYSFAEGDDPYLAAMARGASRTFIDSTLTDPPSYHLPRFRR